MSNRFVNTLAGALTTTVLVAGLLVAPAQAYVVVYDVDLDGPSEAPPNVSPGTGEATVTVDFDTFLMTLDVSFAGLIGTTTVAHIHCCTAVPGAGAAGVATQTPSFIGWPVGVMAGAYNHTFDMTLATSYNPAFVAAHGGVAGAFSDLIDGFDEGRAYLNIHSSAFPGGEIRGFLQAVPEPGTLALFGIAAAGLAWRRRTN